MASPQVNTAASGPEVRSASVQIEGRRVHFLQAGTGQPVLLVHGIAASVVDWHLNIGALAEHFAVTAIDLPGFGDSDIPPHGLGIADILPFLDAFLNALAIERVTLVGNSMGGLICGHYAIARPQRVDRLLMIDPAGLARDISVHFRLLTLPGLGEWVLRPNPNAGTIAARGLFHDPALAPVAWLEDKVVDRGPRSRTYLLGSLRSGTNIFGLRQEIVMLDGLRRLETPTLVMWGAHDHVVPVRHLGLVQRHLPNAQTYVFPAAGHVPMLECPQEFNRVTVAFLTPQA